ncbi:MAG: ribonuclease Y [Planctomycetales bacterium 4484_123]|nr:MAG: ribonuclease Y [Planctomycetales bacterium 4484_123]
MVSCALILAQITGGFFAVVVAVALLAGILVGLAVHAITTRMQKDALEKELQARVAAAEAEARRIKAQAEAEAKSEFIRRRQEFDAETQQARAQLREEERRLAKREDLIDQKMDTLTTKERSVEMAERAVNEREKALAAKDRQLNDLIAQQRAQLMKVANMTAEEARAVLLDQVRKDAQREADQLIQRELEKAEETAESKARDIIATAIQRFAAEHTSERTVSTVDIPSDDMKGRVIGREGRNIRAFENATGVDVIVDDTPGVVVVSAFDPVRREVARASLEKLIQDGRIHPSRIEEVVAETQKEVNRRIQEIGKQALLDANIRGLHPKLVQLLGRLHFRTSYGQNVLRHSLEVAYLAQIIAGELGLNAATARRCGLLHDIGKAVDHEVEGGHPEIGAELCRRYGEADEVVEAAAGHHGDVVARFIYTPVVAAADAISAARPGARRETLERYIQRLEKLEEIAAAFEGVKVAYAIQAGREVRVMVDAENVDDRLSAKIAHDIAKRIEEEMQYPGEVKVTLIRELRCVEYAR